MALQRKCTSPQPIHALVIFVSLAPFLVALLRLQYVILKM